MMGLGRGVVAGALLVVFAAGAQAQSLKVADRQAAKSYTAQQLLADPAARDVTIANDFVYRRAMTYKAVPVGELLKGLALGAEDYVEFTATDKFSIAPNLATGYRWANTTIPKRNDGTFVILTFSGGGTRAAGLSFGVLQQLAATKMPDGRSLLDSVDVISSVSGGTFTAMEYGMRGQAMLNDFVANFLQKPVQGMLVKAAFFTPRNLIRLLSPNFHRIDLAAEVYDGLLFHDATFETLLNEQRTHGDRPLIIANATELEIGSRFEWTQDQFDPICSDLSQIHVSRLTRRTLA